MSLLFLLRTIGFLCIFIRKNTHTEKQSVDEASKVSEFLSSFISFRYSSTNHNKQMNDWGHVLNINSTQYIARARWINLANTNTQSHLEMCVGRCVCVCNYVMRVWNYSTIVLAQIHELNQQNALVSKSNIKSRQWK